MTRQPLVASVCVDYLSHPLSPEHLLVCYQQITRQIAHAPQSAKDAATSLQHQSQALLELLSPQHQHQNLAVPKTKERPAPVGCKSQLRRMQNALWRRSSQSSLAKDVALVRPESLNWQKECDVLWLYGPLYKVDIVQLEHPLEHNLAQHRRPTLKQKQSPRQDNEWAQEQRELEQDRERHHSHEDVHLAAAAAVFKSPPESPKSEAADPVATLRDCATVSVVAAAESASTPTASLVSCPGFAFREGSAAALQNADLESSTSPNDTPASPSAIASQTAVDAQSTSTFPLSLSSARAPMAPSRPQKSVLKQQGTMTQTLEELRAFTHSPQYLALCNFLALPLPPNLAFADGSRSEPMSPISNSAGPAFMLPIFPAPTKYHFRSHDRRRASFPKSSCQSGRLNGSVDVNMSIVNLQHLQRNGPFGHGSHHVSSACAKQLRFSLEVQELVFLPTSPPFRISRAKPTRAHSDPAIRSTHSSSFIAPSPDHPHAIWPCPADHHSGARHQREHSHRPGNCKLISTAAASADVSTDTNAATTTFIKIQSHNGRYTSSSSSSRRARSSRRGTGLPEEEDGYAPECHFHEDVHDEYCFDECCESTEDEDLEADEDEDELNGLTKKGSYSRFRFAPKDAVVARRVPADEHAHATPGVLWQVYTAVTGMKELIAWYGSMVYHSSSL
ncbi:hypothetical protein BGZ67_001839 [Mortierella alpina]|nr:hypothetical protein BGZ67_001839 [Mortierella alpina]